MQTNESGDHRPSPTPPGLGCCGGDEKSLQPTDGCTRGRLLVSSRAEEVTLGNSPAVRRARMDMREWIDDDSRKEGGYWFAGHLPENAHGESGTYNNWYCRCLPCTRAHTKAKRLRRKERWAERIWIEATEDFPGHWYAPNAPEHGLSATLRNWGCHCPPCTNAELEKNKEK